MYAGSFGKAALRLAGRRSYTVRYRHAGFQDVSDNLFVHAKSADACHRNVPLCVPRAHGLADSWTYAISRWYGRFALPEVVPFAPCSGKAVNMSVFSVL